ncbi:MAG: ElyC/SanA/YdcF family protein [Ferruginibacter sp.]
MIKRRILRTAVVFLFIVAALVFFCNRAVQNAAAGKLYTDVQEIPFRKTGLLLGTSKYDDNGKVNPFFLYRIQAAVALLKAGKIKYIIVSGDNGSTDYNEPEQMRQDLIAAGIDSTVIFPDYAGFRTFDSVVRLKEIFGQDSVTFISQRFHNERAIYIASKEGIDAIGFNAADVYKKAGFRVQLREKFARVKVFLDFIFGKKPKFLGKQINLP